MAGVLLGQAAEPTRPHVNPIYPNPTAKVGDPFRMPDEWEAAGRGQVERFSIIASTGAKLVARLYSPNAVPNEQPLPAIAFIPGLQSYNEVNEWFAEGMAEAGYVVLILDPQGQGDSENLPHNPDGSINCSASGCPNAQTNDKPETASAIEFLLSTSSRPYKYAVGANAAGTLTYNPLWARIDDNRIGIAGHSLGAIAVTPIGQEDPRVKAVVSYDNIDAKLPAADLRRSSSASTTPSPASSHPRTRRARPTPTNTSRPRTANWSRPASTPWRSTRAPAPTTSSDTSPSRRPSRPAGTASG